MGCDLCKSETWDVYIDDSCDYTVCWDCWSTLPKYIPTREQAWKLIQLRGDKSSETL